MYDILFTLLILITEILIVSIVLYLNYRNNLVSHDKDKDKDKTK